MHEDFQKLSEEEAGEEGLEEEARWHLSEESLEEELLSVEGVTVRLMQHYL